MKVTLYTRADCNFCVMAKYFLQEHQIGYDELEIGKTVDRDTVLQLVEDIEHLDNKLPIALIVDNGETTYTNYNGLLDYITNK